MKRLFFHSIAAVSLVLSGEFALNELARATMSKMQSKTNKVLEVGVILPFRDKFNDTFSYTMGGIETAKVLFEKTHPEIKVVLKKYPHNENLASVLEASKRVIQDHISAVIGGELSEESFVLRDQLEPKKIIFITPTSSNPEITENHPYAFRVCFSDRWVASELARFTVDRLKPKAVGLIHDLSSPFTDFQSKQYLEIFNQRMALLDYDQQVPIFEEKMIKGTVNFDSQIRNFIQNRVTHVVLLLHQSEFFRFVTQASVAGFFPTYVGSEGWGSNEHIYRDLLDGSPWKSKFVAYRSSFWNEDVNTSIAKLFKSEYHLLTSHQPNPWSAVGFDAAWVLLTAMSRTSNPWDGEEIRHQLQSIHGMELVTHSNFTFGPDNSPHSALPIFRMQPTGSALEVTLK